ncbi:MAG: alpha/beta hydrolase, partial [Pseudomonadota bacterium]
MTALPPMTLYDDQTQGIGPGSEQWSEPESLADIWWSNKPVARNVVSPTLTPYLPDADAASGAAVILCPGGGFHFLAVEQEGHDVANALCKSGVAAFVLKYRLVQTGDDFAEAQRNMGDPDRRQKMTELMPMIREDGLRALAK